MGTILLNGDKPVLRFNLDFGEYQILNRDLLPFTLRNKIEEPIQLNEMSSKADIQKAVVTSVRNLDYIQSFFASRVLPLTRENAKKIYSLFFFEQAQDDHSKALIAITCRAVSLQDNFWVKDENDPVEWKDVNLRHQHLSETVAQVALHGSSLTLQGKEHTPELNGQGAYPKAWKREEDGLYLYKLGSHGTEDAARIEVAVSNILDKTNVPHVRYLEAESQGIYACKCKCLTDDDHSILPGMDFRTFCTTEGKSPELEILKIDSDMIYKMWIVDYLISNRDRHGMNWGLYYDANTMQIQKCHPLFDHNNAFDVELMKDKEARYLYDPNYSMIEAAKYAMKKVDFAFSEPVKRSDFLTIEQFESFCDRAGDLGLKVQERTVSATKEGKTSSFTKAVKRAVSMAKGKEKDSEKAEGTNVKGKDNR